MIDKSENVGKMESQIRRVAFISLFVNIGLVIIKLFLSIIAGSLALRADAVHSLVDVFGSTALILGLVISNRKTKTFPYGLYKVENIVSILISSLLFLTSYEIVSEALSGEAEIIPYGGWVLVAVCAMIPVPLLFGQYEVRAGRKFNSPSLIADGKQFKADALTTSLVLLALLAQRSGFFLDRIVAAIIAIFILRAGWEILVSGMRVLLDASVDVETLNRIRSLVEAEPTVGEVKDLTARNSGRYLFVEASVLLRISDLHRASQASKRIESSIRSNIPNIDRVLIHFEPQEKSFLRYAIALEDSFGKTSRHFGKSPYFAIIDLDLSQRSIKREEIVQNPHKDMEKGRGLKVAEFLLGHKIDVVISKESLSGKGPGYALSEAGVMVEQTEAESLAEMVKHLV
jgi:cation diffusion facilitator family transporter